MTVLNVSGNIPKLYVFSFLKMALFPMAIITLFWKDQIGLSLTQIMILQGVFSAANLLMEYPSGVLGDRLGYRWTLSLSSALGVLGWAWYCQAGSFGGLLLAEILLGSSFAFASGSDTAMLYESVRELGREADYAAYDGRMAGWAQAGEACGALFAGVLYGIAPLFPFYLQVAVWVCALLICRSLKEEPPGEEAFDVPLPHPAEAWLLALKGPPLLRHTILYAAVLGLASFYPVWLIQPHMQAQGVPLAWFGPIWAGANAIVALFSLFSQRAMIRFGLRGMSWLFLLLCIAGYAGLGLVGGMWSFLFYYLLTAMRGLQGPALRSQLQHASQRRHRASILSLKSLLFRVLFVLTGPVIGWAADHAGLQSTFLLLMICLPLVLLPLGSQYLRSASPALQPE